MIFSKPSSSVVKGQLRCFQCRVACGLKDGDWCDYKNQQVFLCIKCQQTKREPARG